MFLRRAAAPVLLILFGVAVYAPLLFWDKAFLGEEQSGFYYAISSYVQQSLQNHTSLAWQSGYFGGVSASLDQFVGGWYAPHLFLLSHLGLFDAQHISIAFATIVGLLLAYWFGRVQGWGSVSSIVLALGYFSATTLAWLQIGTIAANSFMVLPGILLSLWYAAYRKTYAATVFWGGFFLGIGFLAGFVQVVFYVYVIAGCYALFLDWVLYRPGPLLARLPVSFSYAGVTIVGIFVGFKQFFPSAYLIDLTIRTNTYAIQNATHPYLTELLALIAPPYFSIPFLGGGSSSGFYIGALGLVFVALGLVYYRTRESVFFAGLYLLVCAFAFRLPLFGWLNDHMPPFSHMGGNFRWMLAAAFPLAYLGAAGVEGFLHDPARVSKQGRRITVWLATIVAVLGVLGSMLLQLLTSRVSADPVAISRLLSWYDARHPLMHAQSQYVDLLRRTLETVSTMFSLQNPKLIFALFCWVLAAVFFMAVWRGVLKGRYISHGILSLSLLYIFIPVVFQWNDFVPQALYMQEPQIVDILRQREPDAHTYRIFGYLLGDGLAEKVFSGEYVPPAEMTRVHLEALTNNSNLFWGIERMDGMEPYRMLRHNRLLNTVIAYDTSHFVFDTQSPALLTSPLDQLYNRDVQKSVTVDEKLGDLKRWVPILSMMNVKYIYSPYELVDTRLKLVSVVPIMTKTVSVHLYLYENTTVLPRLYLAQRPQYVLSRRDTDALLAVVNMEDFSKRTVIECADCMPVGDGEGVVEVVHYENGSVEARVTLAHPQYLVFSESLVPGWVARADGAPVNIYPANYLFQAIWIPAGTHTVSFAYQDPSVVELLRK